MIDLIFIVIEFIADFFIYKDDKKKRKKRKAKNTL